MEIVRLGCDLPYGFDDLARCARIEGFAFLDRMHGLWREGTERFDGPQEAIYAAVIGPRTVGVCGLSADPYCRGSGIGRLRHLYVHPNDRRYGYGSALVERCLRDCTGLKRVRLRTDEAGAFYESLGFEPTDERNATHAMNLSARSLRVVSRP